MNIKQKIWTEDDFDIMSWHDSKVYGIGFDEENFKLLLDIDYIIDWVKPEPNNIYFSFWVSPATLVFTNVYDLNIEISTTLGIDICKVFREKPIVPINKEYINKDTEWLWRISSNQGDITFRSIGYKQYIRRKPILTDGQNIPLIERAGISFAEECYPD